jgi:FtsH-binding integral membrane protein
MQGILYEEHSAWLFILVTVLMGGWAAWQAGRAVASTWRPLTTLFVYVLLLGWGVRFLHFALFEGTFLSLQFYLVDTVIVGLAALAGWRMRRAWQMGSQYRYAFVRTGPFTWKRRGDGASGGQLTKA